MSDPCVAPSETRQHGALDRVLARATPCVLRALGASLRYHVEGEERVTELLRARRPVIVASWHGRILLGVTYMLRFRPFIMISRSRDGERIARAIEPLGWRTVRGSSSRGGAEALRELVGLLGPGSLAVHIVDGPRGPAGEIKSGLLRLAQHTGAPIVPIYGTATPCWRARSWDRMEVPLPFAHVWARYGEPVEVAPDLSDDAREQLRRELQERLRREYTRLDREVHGRATAGAP
jgi:lysophospholipid acyltransferase (LPLAT)-like uncharacterized protein